MFAPRRVLVPLGLVAVARDVARLAALVARLGAVRAVARDVPGLVTIVAGLTGVVTPALRAVSRDVPRLVTVITRRLIRALSAFACYVSCAVTSVATIGLLLAIPCEVTGAVAFEALLPLAAEARVARSHAALRALAGEVPGPIALITYTGTHRV